MDLNLIKENYWNVYGQNQKYLFDYYQDNPETVPIYQRVPETQTVKDKFHTNMHIDFPGMIIDFKVGYMGKDIQFNLEKTPYSEVKYTNAVREIREFEFNNNLAALDSESMKLSSISGISHRLLYIKNGMLRVKNIEGWKVIYEYDDDIYNPNRAFWFYTDEDGNDRCDIFDDETITHYIKVEYKEAGKVKELWELRPIDEDGNSVEEHLLGQVPIFPILNNQNWQGDFSKATSTMDRYDEVISDLVGEIKSIRGNYIVMWGVPFTDVDAFTQKAISVKNYLKENNLIAVPIDEEGNKLGDVKMLDVDIPDEAIQNTLTTLRSHIFEESKSIDIKNISMTADARVFTIKTMLMPVENNAKTTENYYKMALRKQYKILSYFLVNSGRTSFDYRDLDFDFNRSFPTDETAKAQSLSTLFNMMSPQDAYRIAGYEDAEKLEERYLENMSTVTTNLESENLLEE